MRHLSLLVLASVITIDAGGVQAATCESIHAAKIAIEARLPDCTTTRLSARHLPPAAGSLLSEPARSACVDKTADECAAYFRANPSAGLIDTPATAGTYTAYHVLAGDLRLPDGTRPMVYYKPAPGTATSNPRFDNWLFFFYGGAGKCAQEVVQIEGELGTSSLTAQGEECLGAIDYANQQDTKAGTSFSRDRHLDLHDWGILGDAPDNPFANYNRVVITKTNDYYIGDVTKVDVDVGDGFRVATMQLQGNAIVKQVLAMFTTPRQGGADLDDARNVLFVTSSSGTNSVHRMDEWRLATLALAPTAYVGLMANSSGVTPDSFTLEDYDAAPCGSVYIANCGASYDDPPHGVTAANGLTTIHPTLPRPIAFSHATFLDYVPTVWDGTAGGVAPGGEAHGLASVSASPNSVLDKSCLATEPPGDRWRCRSTLYVMFNHLRTPLFIAHSLRDSSNIGGVIKGVASRDANGMLPRWNTIQWSPANPLFGESPLESLGRFQFSSYVDDRDLPTGAAGDSRLAGPLGVWAADCAQHEPEKYDHSFVTGDVVMGAPANNNLERGTLAETLVRWFEGRARSVRIDGYGATDTVYPGLATPPAGCQ